MRTGIRCLIVVLAVGLLATTAMAKDVPMPEGEVVLTVAGTIALTNQDGAFVLDMDMVKALPKTAYLVEDPWLGEQVYAGVTLATLLEYVGAPLGAEKVVLVASDDKEFEVALADALVYPILLAYESDGDEIIEGMGGPIKIAYPYNAYPEVEELYPPENWTWWVVTVRVDY